MLLKNQRQAVFLIKIQIKVDKEIKSAAKESDILKLVHFIDKSTFIGFRDVTAILQRVPCYS